MNPEAIYRHVTIVITDTETGESAFFQDTLPVDADDPSGLNTYSWGDGNYSCDCNRADFLADALKRERAENSPCGSSRYHVLIRDTVTMEVVYRDKERA